MNTPILNLPYPTSADTADVPRDIQALALALDPIGTVPVGALMLWAAPSAPIAWLLCQGQQVDASLYPALAVVLGQTAGKIQIPNLTDRFPVGAGANALLGTGGANAVSLTDPNQIPAHGHPVSTSGRTGQTNTDHLHTFGTLTGGIHEHHARPGAASFLTADAGQPEEYAAVVTYAGGANITHLKYSVYTETDGGHAHTGTTNAMNMNSAHDHAIDFSLTSGSVGGSATHENRPPFVAVNFIIRAL